MIIHSSCTVLLGLHFGVVVLFIPPKQSVNLSLVEDALE